MIFYIILNFLNIPYLSYIVYWYYMIILFIILYEAGGIENLPFKKKEVKEKNDK